MFEEDSSDFVTAYDTLFRPEDNTPVLPQTIDFAEVDEPVFRPLRQYDLQYSFVDGEFMVLDFFLNKDPTFNNFYKSLDRVKTENEVKLEDIGQKFLKIRQDKLDYPNDAFTIYDNYLHTSNLFCFYSGQNKGIDFISLQTDEEGDCNFSDIVLRHNSLEISKLNLYGRKQAYAINIDKRKDLNYISDIFMGLAQAQKAIPDIIAGKGFATEDEVLAARYENTKTQAFCTGFLTTIKDLYPPLYRQKREDLSKKFIAESIKAMKTSRLKGINTEREI